MSKEIQSAARLLDKGEIARGGMGSIRRMMDQTIQREVATKVFDPALTMKDPEASRRFLQEGQITGQLDHPNIVPVYHIGVAQDGAPAFFTMKLVEGETLTALIDRRDLDRPSERELERLLRLYLKVCDAVAFAHSRGVVHRDLKPDNVMVGSHGQVYVMDWGCARPLRDRMVTDPGHGGPRRPGIYLSEVTKENIGMVIGTPSYMAPEQAWGRVADIDTRTDVFALGAILYRLLTQVPPYEGTEFMAVVHEAQQCKIKNPQVVVKERHPTARLPKELCRITMKALAALPNDRYQSVEALAGDLEAFVRGGTWLASRIFAAGEVVVQEGDIGDEAYIITAGRCEAFKIEKGARVTLRVMGPGSVFGETAVLTGGRRTASVIALEDLTVLVVSRASLVEELCFDSWTGAFIRTLAERFRDLDAQLAAARQAAQDARLASWVRDYVIALGKESSPGVFEAPWAAVATALNASGVADGADVIAALTRCPDVELDRTRAMVLVDSPGASAARRAAAGAAAE
jgi:eukaryotic-like serine/threonine-protein kinase